MSETKLFVEAYVEIRKALFEAFEYYIEIWNEAESEEPIWEFLGFTEKQYIELMQDPEKLIYILEEKIKIERTIN